MSQIATNSVSHRLSPPCSKLLGVGARVLAHQESQPQIARDLVWPEPNRKSPAERPAWKSQPEIAIASDSPSHPDIAMWHCVCLVSDIAIEFYGVCDGNRNQKSRRWRDFGALR